jgi:hypothetical protein
MAQLLINSDVYKLLVILLLSFAVNGQNLIPNPGFEKTTGCPGAFVFLKNVEFWTKLDNHYGTPDQYYTECPYNGKNNPMHPGQYAFEGKGHGGQFCGGNNLREYMTTPLTEPMVKDSIYELSFYVMPATGYGTFIDSYGVHFSKEAPTGTNDRSLAVIELEEHIGNARGCLINDTVNWTQIKGTYKAKGGERFATFGNFRSDASTKMELYKSNAIVPSRSYMLIDGVNLDFVTDETISDTVVNLVKDRELVVKDIFETTKRSIKISIWDHVQEDGDLVHLLWNDELIVENHLIKKQRYQFELSIEPGEHLLKLHALNLGSIPPNTAAIRISDGKKQKTFILSSDLGTTECLKILVE